MTSFATGYKQSLYFGNEAVYGSTVTVDQSIGLVQSINPTEKNGLIKVRTLGGTRDYSNIVPGKFEASGSFEFYLQGAAMLRQAIGEDTATTSTIDSGPRIHTGASYVHIMGSAASPGVNSFPSFTLEFADAEDAGTSATTANLRRTYSGCRINTATISGSVDEPVKIAMDWQAQTVAISTAAATSVTAATTDPYVFYQGAVYATTGTIVYNTIMDSASEIAEVNTFSMSINNNLEPVWYISGTTNAYQNLRGLKGLIPKGRDYETSLGLHFKDKAMYEKFLGAVAATTPQSTLTGYNIVLDFVRSGTIGSSPKLATDNYLRVVMASCKFNDINIAGGPEDIVSENITVFVPSAKFYVVDSDASYLS